MDGLKDLIKQNNEDNKNKINKIKEKEGMDKDKDKDEVKIKEKENEINDLDEKIKNENEEIDEKLVKYINDNKDDLNNKDINNLVLKFKIIKYLINNAENKIDIDKINKIINEQLLFDDKKFDLIKKLFEDLVTHTTTGGGKTTNNYVLKLNSLISKPKSDKKKICKYIFKLIEKFYKDSNYLFDKKDSKIYYIIKKLFKKDTYEYFYNIFIKLKNKLGYFSIKYNYKTFINLVIEYIFNVKRYIKVNDDEKYNSVSLMNIPLGITFKPKKIMEPIHYLTKIQNIKIPYYYNIPKNTVEVNSYSSPIIPNVVKEPFINKPVDQIRKSLPHFNGEPLINHISSPN